VRSSAIGQWAKATTEGGFGDIGGSANGGFAKKEIAQERFFLNPLDDGKERLKNQGGGKGTLKEF